MLPLRLEQKNRQGSTVWPSLLKADLKNIKQSMRNCADMEDLRKDDGRETNRRGQMGRFVGDSKEAMKTSSALEVSHQLDG